jgi:hypothetical protein
LKRELKTRENHLADIKANPRYGPSDYDLAQWNIDYTKKEIEKYHARTLSDMATAELTSWKGDPDFIEGKTHVWYSNDAYFTNSVLEYERGKSSKKPTLPASIADLKKTHVLLGSIALADPLDVWDKMQWEYWRKWHYQEALLEKLGLNREPSMLFGDAIVIGKTIHYPMQGRVETVKIAPKKANQAEPTKTVNWKRYTTLFPAQPYAETHLKSLMKLKEQTFIHFVDDMMKYINLDMGEGQVRSKKTLQTDVQNTATVNGVPPVFIEPAIKKAVEMLKQGKRGYIEERIKAGTYPSDTHWTGD